jgi:hypothetical protein
MSPPHAAHVLTSRLFFCISLDLWGFYALGNHSSTSSFKNLISLDVIPFFTRTKPCFLFHISLYSCCSPHKCLLHQLLPTISIYLSSPQYHICQAIHWSAPMLASSGFPALRSRSRSKNQNWWGLVHEPQISQEPDPVF